MKLNFTPLQEMSLRNRAIVICCGALMIIFAFYFFICRPKSLATNDLKRELARQHAVLRDAQRDFREMPDPAGYYLGLQAEEGRVKALLPDSDAITDLLRTLNTLGKEQNIRITGIKKGTSVDHKSYYEIPLEITVSGSYPNLLAFIRRMENLPRFNSVTKIGVHAEENVLTMQLAVTVYAYGPMPQIPKGKSK